MPDKTNIPVIFLAIADGQRDLRYLPKELKALKRILEKAEEHRHCEVVPCTNANLTDIFDIFEKQKYRNRIAIFHFAGHANGFELLLEDRNGKTKAAHSAGLIPFLASQHGLKLVFLNGCATEQQARNLSNAGVPAVIGTSQNIQDDLAYDLARRFYSGLAEGHPLEECWKAAEKEVITKVGVGNFRDMYRQKNTGQDRFPWHLIPCPGAESVLKWNLPAAVDDPLFGLPEIPRTHNLPVAPFRFLTRYQRKDAEIFFGRGADIRELYQMVSEPHGEPLILFHGQSGVGKSSLLEAGLLPRLENSHQVHYLRRDPQKGLLETLLGVFPQGKASKGDLAIHWRAFEAENDQPLLIILDQVEEAITRHLHKLPSELDDFFAALAPLFHSPQSYPRGKLILGYRKEYHPDIQKYCAEYNLPCNDLFLAHLDRRAVMEVVTGLNSHPALSKKYKLDVEEPLPAMIADDLLADPHSPVAPVLQILLAKLWEQVKGNHSRQKSFTVAQYQALRREGLAMETFFQEQMAALEKEDPDRVRSGLALDVLKFHTTPLGTAASRSVAEVKKRYAHLPDIETLLSRLKKIYLLSEGRESNAENSLAHDTLAPIVINEYTDSDWPGQRISRIFDLKLREVGFRLSEDSPAQLKPLLAADTWQRLKDLKVLTFRGKRRLSLALQEIVGEQPRLLNLLLSEVKRDFGEDENAIYLTLEDLKLAEKIGEQGMRAWNADEKALVNHSWQKLRNSDEWMTRMIQDKGYYDQYRNPDGKGIVHQYELQAKGQVVFDAASGLVWQQFGSDQTLSYDLAKTYIAQLNKDKYANYNDWRLPTLQEAMSLMEAEKMGNNLYINPVFDAKQFWIWTSDQPGAHLVWDVDFSFGGCDFSSIRGNWYVRAVRFGQSSP